MSNEDYYKEKFYRELKANKNTFIKGFICGVIATMIIPLIVFLGSFFLLTS